MCESDVATEQNEDREVADPNVSVYKISLSREQPKVDKPERGLDPYDALICFIFNYAIVQSLIYAQCCPL